VPPTLERRPQSLLRDSAPVVCSRIEEVDTAVDGEMNGPLHLDSIVRTVFAA
jgi:hypothetical protein